MKQAAEREAAAPRLEEAMSPAARAPPHAIGTPAVARSERTWGRPPFQVKTRVGCSGFCSAHGLPVAAGNASGGGSAAGRHLAPGRHLAAGRHLAPGCGPAAAGPAAPGAVTQQALQTPEPTSDHPTRVLAGAATSASRRRRPTTTGRLQTTARRGPVQAGGEYSWLSRRCC